ncbi:MAG: hypothetical protein NDJ19_12210 [Ramlibacter sp.]|nr:hypothetical protein [Ramlibacter sp.]
MRLLVGSAIIFFATLLAAALVTLGSPAALGLRTAQAAQPRVHAPAPLPAHAHPSPMQGGASPGTGG